jgi:acyl-CoA thioesterase FadM
MHDLLAGYPVVIEIPVAWGEMDAFQHVNNVAYIRYFESGRIAYFERQPMMEEMAAHRRRPDPGVGFVQVSIPADFPGSAAGRHTCRRDQRRSLHFAPPGGQHPPSQGGGGG